MDTTGTELQRVECGWDQGRQGRHGWAAELMMMVDEVEDSI
jgi:hypothetical protein